MNIHYGYKPNQGLSVHCHHDILMEYCTDFDKRVAYIRSDKPKNEQEIRLEVFKLLPKEAIRALPKSLIKVYADWKKAYAVRDKANADRNKAYPDRIKAYDDLEKAYADRDKADADWNKTKEKEQWHKKYCGCRYWNGEELVFK